MVVGKNRREQEISISQIKHKEDKTSVYSSIGYWFSARGHSVVEQTDKFCCELNLASQRAHSCFSEIFWLPKIEGISSK